MLDSSKVHTPEPNLAARSSGKRLFELDSLRGIAACIVVLHHLRLMFIPESLPARWFLRPFVDGHAAVILFFSLSGYVLSLAYWNGRQLPYKTYLTRRFFRIYMPYAAAVALAILVAKPLLFAHLPLTPWFYQTWHTRLTAGLIAAQFFKMRVVPDINTAFWSLRYEVEMSILFPGLCFVLTKLRPIGAVVLACVCDRIGSYLLYRGGALALYGMRAELGRTIMFASCFIFGAVVAWKQDDINRAYERTPMVLRALILLISIAGFFSLRELYVIPSSCLLIIFAQHGLARRLLRHTIPEYLGKISYSLYLIHGTVLFAVTILLYQRVALWLMVVIYLTLSFGVAHFFNTAVEDPSDRLGKRLTGVFQKT